jgi:hypothetical protein
LQKMNPTSQHLFTHSPQCFSLSLFLYFPFTQSPMLVPSCQKNLL